jgi:hypothetical protein
MKHLMVHRPYVSYQNEKYYCAAVGVPILNMTYVNVALAILLFINGALCLNSCIKLPQQFLDADTTEDELFELTKSDEGEAIDWWFLVKPPQKSLFLYFDSAMEADNQPMVTRSKIFQFK